MDRTRILEAIEEEIGKLERVRDLLRAPDGIRAPSGIGARAEGNGNRPVKKRLLSADARNRIAQAQKRRWARQHQEAAAAINA